MRYVMKQKWFGLLSDFYITDEAGNNKFYVKCNKGFIWDSFSFQDLKEKELLLIEESSSHYYYIKRDGNPYASIYKRDGWIYKGFLITMADENETEIKLEGNIASHEYSFTNITNKKEIAKVSKTWISLTDTYGIEINQGEDELLILAYTVLIDVFFHTMESKKS